jgi:hypothetical protein
MHLDEPFPLEAIPHRVGRVLLREFKGRCPSVREVDEIPDKNWLATPGMGPASLQIIRSITHAARQQEVSQIASHRLSDAELLRRLEGLQEDLRWLCRNLCMRMERSLSGSDLLMRQADQTVQRATVDECRRTSPVVCASCGSSQSHPGSPGHSSLT